MKRCGPGYGIKIVFGVIFFGLIMTTAVMLLWNWLIPSIFHGREITFFEAFGILALTRILAGFKCGWGHRHCCHHSDEHKGFWRKRWEEKLANMTPEEREKAKEKYKKWCGPWKGYDENKES
jgi:hypothetical protein